MKLYNVEPRTWVKVISGKTPPDCKDSINQELFFDHLDGMYSYCKDRENNIVHIAGWTEVTVIGDK
jgi:hypothetical protein